MDKKTRDILTRPFDKAAIKTRKGPGGKLLQYVELQDILDRLNEAFGHNWSHEVVCREQFEDQVIVEIRLTANGIIKTGIGGSSIRRSKNGGKLLSLADDFKMGEADALKRAARSFGVATQLYRDGEQVEMPQEGHAANENHGEDRREQPSRITTAQIAKLKELVGELGSDWQSFRQWVRSERGVNVEYATKQVGSEFIEDLIKRSRRKRSMNGSGHHVASRRMS